MTENKDSAAQVDEHESPDVHEAQDAPGNDEKKVRKIEINATDDEAEDQKKIEEATGEESNDASSGKDDGEKTNKVEPGKNREEIEKLEKLVEQLTKERDDYKDTYLRNLAEIDNFRKRIKKEKEEYQKYVLGDFLLDLLAVVDNLERALKSKNCNGDDSGGGSIISGVEMIYKQLIELMKKNNVEEIEALNKPFDPNLHQAISREEQEDISEPIVIEVYQKGFLYNGKLLRPSLARVAVPADIDEQPAEVDETGSDDEDAD